MTETELRRLRSLIGSAEPPTDVDLEADYVRLGSVDEVALEILQGRYADLLSGPTKWSVEGDFSIDNTASLNALAKQIAALTTSVSNGPVLPTMTVHTMTRADPWR